jgi:predicted RNA binding protein YcfA (HicA-like mRNA interferase family)
MGQRKYPPLTPAEIIAIVIARGFILHHTKGDHKYYVHTVKGEKRIMQVDTGNPLYTDHWLKLVITQSGMSREDFYCSTTSTAKKINMKCVSEEELINWVLA